MNASLRLLIAPAAIGLAGCVSSPAPKSAQEPHVKPSLVLLTADQAEARGIRIDAPAKPPIAGSDLQPLDASMVAAPAEIKVYTLNRAVDAADPALMHEEHVVYRREVAPRWRLDVPADQKLLVGPRATDGRQDLHPLLEKELTTYLTDQRRATEENRQAIAALFQALDALTRQQQALAEKALHDDAGAKPAKPAEPTPTRAPTDAERPDHG